MARPTPVIHISTKITNARWGCANQPNIGEPMVNKKIKPVVAIHWHHHGIRTLFALFNLGAYPLAKFLNAQKVIGSVIIHLGKYALCYILNPLEY